MRAHNRFGSKRLHCIRADIQNADDSYDSARRGDYESFRQNLPKSLRESIEGFVGSNKDEFRRENTSRIITTPLPDGGFDATFALVENGDAIFEIRIKLPNAEYTRLAEKNWEAQNQNIYIDTLLALVKTYQNAQNSDAAETCAQNNI